LVSTIIVPNVKKQKKVSKDWAFFCWWSN